MNTPKPKPHQPTPQSRQRVLDLLQAGVALDRIASVLDVSISTVARRYKAEIEAAGVRTGPAAHVPTDATRRMVELAAAAGILQDEIGQALGMSPRSLRTHYRNELDTAKTLANMKVAANLLRAATGDVTKPATITAIMWWQKNRMGWTDRSNVEMKVARLPEELSDEELARIAAGGIETLDDEPPTE